MKKISMFMLSLYLVLNNGMMLTAAENEPDKLTGKPVIDVFSNFHSGFGRQKDDRGFALERSYLGYAFDYGKEFSGKVVFDVGSSKLAGSDLDKIAYIKNAFVTYHPNKQFSFSAGLIGSIQFSVQEKFWNKRYLYKSFQDEYKFGSSADLGLSVKYKFNDWISADAMCSNGEGYKKANIDKSMRYGAGVTITPSKQLTFRAYADNYDTPTDDTTGKSQSTVAMFAGWKNENFSIGAEYNMQLNQKFKEDHDMSGLSIYGDAKICKDMAVFARWDHLQSKDDWSEKSCGQEVIAGLEFKLHKCLTVSPNFRAWLPQTGKSDEKIFAFLNMRLSIK